MSRRLQPVDGSLRIEDARLAPLDDSSPPSPLSSDPPRLSSPGTASLVHRVPIASSSMPALSSPSTSKPSFFKRIIRTFVPSKKPKPSTQTHPIPPKSPLSQTPILSAPPKPTLQPRPKHISLSAPNAAPIPIDQIHLAPSRAQRQANAIRVSKWLEATSPTAETFDDPNLPSASSTNFDRDDDLGRATHVAVASEGHEPDLIIDHKAFGEDDNVPLPPAIVFGSPLSSDTPSNETQPSPTPQFAFPQEIDLPSPVVPSDGEDLPPLPASPNLPAPEMAANRASAFDLLTGGSKSSSSSKRASALPPPSSFAAQQERKSAIPLSKSAPYGKHQSLLAASSSATPKRASLFNLAHIGGRSPSMPPPPKAGGRAAQLSLDSNGSKRQSVMPTIHTTASISAEVNGITDEESKRLTEAAFMF